MTISFKEQKSTQVGLNKESEISWKYDVARPDENWSLDPGALLETEANTPLFFGLLILPLPAHLLLLVDQHSLIQRSSSHNFGLHMGLTSHDTDSSRL